MKSYLYILFILLSYQMKVTGQEKKKLVLLIEDSFQIISTNQNYYRIGYYVKSNDAKFKHDLYFFDISPASFDLPKLNDLGKEIKLKDLSYEKSSEFFKNKSACEVHEEFSLVNLYIIKEVSKDKEIKKYIVWKVIYSGTVKDVEYTSYQKL